MVDLKNIFENIQDGTVLAFYRNDFIGSIVPFATKEKKGEKAPHHVAIVYEVKRKISDNYEICTFKQSEQGFHGGKYREINIFKYQDIFYTTDEYYLKQDFIKMFKIKMTQQQVQIGIEDAISQIGKKYGYNRLIFASEFIEKILPKKLRNYLFIKLNKVQKRRICSTHIALNLKKAGFAIPENEIFSPLEIIKLIEKL